MFNIEFVQYKSIPNDIIPSELDLAAVGVSTQSGLNIKAYNVLSSLHLTYSKALNKNVYSYWDSVASYEKHQMKHTTNCCCNYSYQSRR
ncbi:hypothetical protein [Pseudoalteromonas luteoviolacea]|uniref:Uncharacterized protein n=1 Tax=Pseudoalteromonas luteoviolacea H33 TaxID=1365251 RepID=A0A161Z333_9GAMM|nr:hypothetical protein [Pseudoalteromonas luteoviolacea]KZN51940.1 hypothetical protein N476_01040 [Pseudoalteromonas luteoviolacea H33]KZN78656.1 hypothetical protein N477_07515 [Pseudoalteromonas luteoviolacea H33-S]MBQ4876020.1 hypothetical protein [Pseudoalteromonas luteoviolacea]MBQ4905655.1 hypothetical protein [Pseudoalteromonas luteoviolacea]